MDILESYDFYTFQDLLAFCKERESDKEERYYWGWLDNFDGDLYTIEDLKDDASEDWFAEKGGDEDESPCTVYVFG